MWLKGNWCLKNLYYLLLSHWQRMYQPEYLRWEWSSLLMFCWHSKPVNCASVCCTVLRRLWWKELSQLLLWGGLCFECSSNSQLESHDQSCLVAVLVCCHTAVMELNKNTQSNNNILTIAICHYNCIHGQGIIFDYILQPACQIVQRLLQRLRHWIGNDECQAYCINMLPVCLRLVDFNMFCKCIVVGILKLIYRAVFMFSIWDTKMCHGNRKINSQTLYKQHVVCCVLLCWVWYTYTDSEFMYAIGHAITPYPMTKHAIRQK